MAPCQEFSAMICINSGGSFCSESCAGNLRRPKPNATHLFSEEHQRHAAPTQNSVHSPSKFHSLIRVFDLSRSLKVFCTFLFLLTGYHMAFFQDLRAANLPCFVFLLHCCKFCIVFFWLCPHLKVLTTRIQLSLQLLHPINHKKKHVPWSSNSIFWVGFVLVDSSFTLGAGQS